VITPLKENVGRKYVEYAADAEWVGGDRKPRLVLAITRPLYPDGNAGSVAESVEEWFDELLALGGGARVWLHWGGIGDFRFVLAEAIRRKLPVTEIRESMGRVTQLRLRTVNNEPGPTLVDSSGLLRLKLAKLGEWVGLPKLDVDRTAISRLSRKRLVAYCERDVEILAKGLRALFAQLDSLKIPHRISPAACSANWLRRQLEEPVGAPDDIEQEIRKGFYGGRVEIFREGVQSAPRGRHIFYFDIRSSYPFAATLPLPHQFLKVVENPRARDWERLEGMAWADVEVPVSWTIPPLPHRHMGKLFFPVGRWTGMYTLYELRALHSWGGKFKIHTAWLYSARPWLREAMTSVYARRQRAKEPFENELYKMLLNHGLGKLAEASERECLRLLAPDEVQPLGSRPIGNSRVVSEVRRTFPSFLHVAAGAYVTAIARIRLWRALNSVPHPIYCDTDSIPSIETPRLLDCLPSGLGSIGVKGAYNHWHCLAPKFYRAWNDDGEEEVACKGFPRDLVKSHWQEIAEGKPIRFRHRLGLRESLKKRGSAGIGEAWTLKQLHFENPKRCPTQNGGTRPWTVEELEAQP